MNKKNFVNSILVSILFFLGTLSIPFKELFSSGISVYIITICLVIIFILVNGFNVKAMFLLLLISIIFMIDVMFFGFFRESFDLYIGFLKFGFLYYWFVTSIDDLDDFFSVYYKLAFISLIIILLQVFIFSSQVNYMSLGVDLTYILVAVLYRINFVKSSFADKIYVVFLLIFCMIYANRMSLLTMFLMCLYSNVIGRKTENKLKSVLKDMIGVGIAIFVWIYHLKIINLIWDFLVSKGINSYSLFKLKFMLENNNIDVISSGRDSIYDFAIDTIRAHDFMPVGFGYFGAHTDFQYPHNIIFELLLDFGFFGIPLFMILIYLFAVAVKTSDSRNRYVLVLFFIFSMSRLFVSSSFWLESSLWIMIGLIHKIFVGSESKNENISANRSLS